MHVKRLVSIHDVTPENFGAALELLHRVERDRARPVTLLVAPSSKWDARSLSRLRAIQGRGHSLAAQGHEGEAIGSSGGLGLPPGTSSRPSRSERCRSAKQEALRRVQGAAKWFGEAGLGAPSLYVPPAWDPGSLPLDRFQEIPFEMVELLSGLLETKTGQLTKLPLIGDRVFHHGAAHSPTTLPLRSTSTRMFNTWNCRRARRLGRLRIALHPADLRNASSSMILDRLAEGSRDVTTRGPMRWAGS